MTKKILDGETEDGSAADLDRTRELPTFIPSRNSTARPVMDGLNDLITIMEANIIQEEYGISVMFDQAKLHWEARDPRGYFLVYGHTPPAAIFLWDMEREKAEGKKP